MAEVHIPMIYTITLTTTKTATQFTIKPDISYVRTLPGALKVAQISLNLLAFLIASIFVFFISGFATWFNAVSWIGFIVTGTLLIFYLYHVPERFQEIPWIKFEYIFCMIWSVLYLLAVCLFICNSEGRGLSFFIIGVLSFCAMVVYGYDAWLKWQISRI